MSTPSASFAAPFRKADATEIAAALQPHYTRWDGRPPDLGVMIPLVETAWEIGANPAHLAAVIQHESGFNPRAQFGDITGRAAFNPKKAQGLIQFTPATLVGLGLTPAKVRQMSAEQQLDLVARYYKQMAKERLKGGPLDSLAKLALATFYPAYMAKPVHTLLPENVRNANPGIRTPADYVALVTEDIPIRELEQVAEGREKDTSTASGTQLVGDMMWVNGVLAAQGVAPRSTSAIGRINVGDLADSSASTRPSFFESAQRMLGNSPEGTTPGVPTATPTLDAPVTSLPPGSQVSLEEVNALVPPGPHREAQLKAVAIIVSEMVKAQVPPGIILAALANAYAESGLDMNAISRVPVWSMTHAQAVAYTPPAGIENSRGLFQLNVNKKLNGVPMSTADRQDPVKNTQWIIQEYKSSWGDPLRAAYARGASIEELAWLWARDIERPDWANQYSKMSEGRIRTSTALTAGEQERRQKHQKFLGTFANVSGRTFSAALPVLAAGGIGTTLVLGAAGATAVGLWMLYRKR